MNNFNPDEFGLEVPSSVIFIIWCDSESECIKISAQVESELIELEVQEKLDYLKGLGVNEGGLSSLIKALETDKKCLDTISYQTKKGSTRHISKTAISNIIKYLLCEEDDTIKIDI